jgi:ribosomal protein L28
MDSLVSTHEKKNTKSRFRENGVNCRIISHEGEKIKLETRFGGL